jgi:hypothetical protein
MKTVAYEGGWSVGGDFDQKPIHSYCKYRDPQTIEADKKAVDVYMSGGGSFFCYFYPQWEVGKINEATQFPLVQSLLERNDLMPAEANYGTLIPGSLSPGGDTLISVANADSGGNISAQGAWIDWNIIAPMTQTYRLTDTTTGQGGSYVILVDDVTSVIAGSSGKNLTGIVKMTKGQHTVKIRSTGTAPSQIKNISITLDGAPAAPSLTSADFGDGKCVLKWTSVPSATRYIVYYGTTAGNYTSSMEVGNVSNATITGLDNAATYYVTIQAANANNLLSFCSDEVRVAQPTNNPQVFVNFEGQPILVGQPDFTKPTRLIIQNYLFTVQGCQVLAILKSPDPKNPDQVLSTVSWANTPRIQREDFKPFDLYPWI